jgi:hypothetical protein
MALKSITVTKGPAASGKTFGFRFGPKRPGNSSAGKIEVGEDPVKIDLQSQQATRANLEGQISDLIVRKYLQKVSAEELTETAQRGGK